MKDQGRTTVRSMWLLRPESAIYDNFQKPGGTRLLRRKSEARQQRPWRLGTNACLILTSIGYSSHLGCDTVCPECVPDAVSPGFSRDSGVAPRTKTGVFPLYSKTETQDSTRLSWIARGFCFECCGPFAAGYSAQICHMLNIHGGEAR